MTMTYKQQVEFLGSITSAEADRLANHGNPKMALCGRILASMAERHLHGSYNQVQDARDADAVLTNCDAAEIAEYLSTPRWNPPHQPIWSKEQADAVAERWARC